MNSKKMLIFLEKYYPSILSLAITAIFIFLKRDGIISVDLEKLKNTDIFLIIATSLLAVLITHKSLILSIDNNKGFKKLLTGHNISKRFFCYMNCVIITSTVFIIYSLLVKFFDKLFLLELIILFSSLLILQFIRFIRVFNIVFEESILPENNAK